MASLTANFRTSSELVEWGNEIFDRAFLAEADRYSRATRRMQVGRQGGCSGDLAGVRVIEIPEEYCTKEASIAYDLWLRRLPSIAAVERIAGDLGLPMRALVDPGGNVQAGKRGASPRHFRCSALSEANSIRWPTSSRVCGS